MTEFLNRPCDNKFRYKAVIVVADGDCHYLGEHRLDADDPWSDLTRLAKRLGFSPDDCLSLRGYAEYMPYYGEIVDAETFEHINEETP